MRVYKFNSLNLYYNLLILRHGVLCLTFNVILSLVNSLNILFFSYFYFNKSNYSFPSSFGSVFPFYLLKI